MTILVLSMHRAIRLVSSHMFACRLLLQMLLINAYCADTKLGTMLNPTLETTVAVARHLVLTLVSQHVKRLKWFRRFSFPPPLFAILANVAGTLSIDNGSCNGYYACYYMSG